MPAALHERFHAGIGPGFIKVGKTVLSPISALDGVVHHVECPLFWHKGHMPARPGNV
jgi:hypothetical protein